MAKHSMRGYYALGALVLGIILLYVIVRNVEPFQSQETVYVYFTSGAGNSIKNIISTNTNIVTPVSGSTSKLVVKVHKDYTLQTTNFKRNTDAVNNIINEIKTSGKQTTRTANANCVGSTKRFASYCWVNATDRSQIKGAIDRNNTLTLTGLSNSDLANPVETKAVDKSAIGMPLGANVRITLTLTKK